jgi:tetratricopeptide (TPR) repeat protein
LSAEEQTSPSNKIKSQSPRAENILLERLKNEPEIAPQISKPILAVIFIVILGAGFLIYYFTKKPEKFAENPHVRQQSETVDSAAIYSKRLKFQPLIDSLQAVISINSNDEQAHLTLANVYYECEWWDKAQKEYEFFLAKKPEDVDARVDYGYVLAQTTGDYKAAVREINKGLKYDPEHINALFNAGILTIRGNIDNPDKKKTVAEALSYFNRALASAKKQHNDKMAEQIQTVMDELNKLQEEGK